MKKILILLMAVFTISAAIGQEGITTDSLRSISPKFRAGGNQYFTNGYTQASDGLWYPIVTKPSTTASQATWLEGLMGSTKWGNSDVGIKAEVAGGTAIAFSESWFPDSESNRASTMSDQRLYLSSFFLLSDATISEIHFYVNTAGDYTADNYNGIGIYKWESDGDKTLVAQTTNDGDFWKTAGMNEKSLTTAYEAEAGLYYAAPIYSSSAVVTAPQYLRYVMGRIDYFGIGNNFATQYQFDSQTSLPATISSGATTTGTAFIFSIH